MEYMIIKDKTLPIPVERFCYPVNEYLGVVPFDQGYKIFKLKQCKPFIGTFFATLEDAFGAAKVFTKIYGEYFLFWDDKEWMNVDIPALCQWSVRNGIGVKMYKFIQDTESNGKKIYCESLHQLMDN